MINAAFRTYNYFICEEKNAYGQATISTEVAGTIKMAIFNTSTSTQDNIKYKDASYIGLTHDANINDKYVIAYDTEKLKVLYIQPHGRYKQVYLREI